MRMLCMITLTVWSVNHTVYIKIYMSLPWYALGEKNGNVPIQYTLDLTVLLHNTNGFRAVHASCHNLLQFV